MTDTSQTSSCVVIAIAGASASGKSLIASTIYKELKNELEQIISVLFPKMLIIEINLI